MSVPYWKADTSAHPIVLVHLVGAVTSQQPDVDTMIRIHEDLIEKGERIVMVYDLEGAKPNAQRRQLLVSWLQANKERLDRVNVASAIIVHTPLHRGVLVATLWFIKPGKPLEIFTKRSEAMAWAGEQAAQARILPLARGAI